MASEQLKDRKKKGEILSAADLARHLNISQWSISRAINGHKDVSEDTRERVRKAMEEYGFQPNLYARGLRGRETGMIGVCFPRHGVPIIGQKISELQMFLKEKNYRCLFESTMNRADVEANAVKDFLNLKVEGIVTIQSQLMPADLSPLLEKKDTPCVMIDPVQEGHICPSVSLDRHKAMALLMGHLWELGHRRFALMGFGPRDGWRWPPLVDFAAKHGLSADEVFVSLPKKKADDSFVVAGVELTEQLLQMKPAERPMALICLDDLVALGVVQSLHRAGYSVPNDFSVTGFNNQDIAQCLFPRLTTIDQHPELLMEQVSSLLISQIKNCGGEDADTVLVEPQLVVGESTGPVH
ncbi:LacI family DNA-binding transcriptional regulator [Cerasicoccus arenae]|uniref:Transcriptional regulator n=1 Tax=Cerasicoccus arenae TaxID=424488 RepID=A0A8J3DDH2_9BACT|nr:LacI family DNA-binding transcriptional regulator [Cerasicoccus arenae]MBK1858381.1 LacI family DNA-binding transcriptional regulator [Cerasicoccus arenae]GHC09917.1 transcriptional regulator [Cerasicoccus arenae]